MILEDGFMLLSGRGRSKPQGRPIRPYFAHEVHFHGGKVREATSIAPAETRTAPLAAI
jgi:murein endopeptidase